ncbi:hypothetical protein [Absidia glauca]|uniref:RGS domain-containing protein n=1 Tax=Absidia glauca TaxID=4829 RepID=A0A168Q5S0_ABSGL|nr:hypothetical protein [Absidia glauca]
MAITTTTFNMERGVAKALCQQFIWSRLMSNAVDGSNRSFRDRGIWQITTKGLAVLSDFCQRTQTDHPLLHGVKPISLVNVDRSDDDQLLLNRQSMASLFHAVIRGLSLDEDNPSEERRRSSMESTSSTGSTDPGLSTSSDNSVSSSHDSWFDNRLLQPTTWHSPSPVKRLFSTQACCDWLVSACTIVNRDEAEIVTSEFLRQGWIECQHDRLDPLRKGTLVMVTPKGRQMMADAPTSPYPSNPTATTVPDDGPSARLMLILHDARLRSFFTDFMHATYSSENLNFWIDYNTLLRKCKVPVPHNQKDVLEDALALWTTYLKPGAKGELNVEHELRKDVARLAPDIMTHAHCLPTLLKHFALVHAHVCCLMSNDSVPKFIAWLSMSHGLTL